MEELRAHVRGVLGSSFRTCRLQPKERTLQYRKLTPNLLVRDVRASIAFYRDMLGFEPGMTVPEQPPYVFASVTSGSVEIFFNEQASAAKEYPAF